tara:strand:+ start:508 stop:1266 length:759 start_codon:yes stop_codon:yes gene_type:complete
MYFLSYLELSSLELILVCSIVLFASIVRGFSGFGFAATTVSLLVFIIPAIEIVPIILLLEIAISIYMIPYIWGKINWEIVKLIFLGFVVGSPIGIYLLKILNSNITHFIISIIVIFFSILLIKGYLNKNLNKKIIKISTGMFAGTVNGLSTLGGLPCALFLLSIGIESQIIRGTLAALFFLTDAYALIIAFFVEIIDLKSLYRTIPLLFILPIGVKIGDVFFNKSKEETYRKFALYFLILISVLGLLKFFLN